MNEEHELDPRPNMLGCLIISASVAIGFAAGYITCAWGWWG